MIKLQNQNLIVLVSEKGAELSSIKTRVSGFEYLWQGDSIYWGRKAPVLFPIVGRLKNDQYEIGGLKYNMGQHGFARDYTFVVTGQNDNMVRMSLESDLSTKELYPFDFRLTITYKLDESTIGVTYLVENLDDNTMYFSIGAHPGFNIPLVDNTQFEDYNISFSPNRERSTIPLIGPYIDLSGKTTAEPNGNIALTRVLFDNDALIYETAGKNVLTIQSDKTDHFISLTFEDFPYVGIWSPPKKDAPFVCLEPWFGIADDINANGALKDKLGIIALDGNDSFSCYYSITVN